MNHQNRCNFPDLRLFLLNDLHPLKPLYIQQAPSIVLHIKETENHLFHKSSLQLFFLLLNLVQKPARGTLIFSLLFPRSEIKPSKEEGSSSFSLCSSSQHLKRKWKITLKSSIFLLRVTQVGNSLSLSLSLNKKKHCFSSICLVYFP